MAGDLTLNKFAGAILATALGVMLIKEFSHGAVHAHEQEHGFAYLSEVDPGTKVEIVEEIELPFPQTTWVESMDAEKGAKYFQVCKTCHSVEPGPSNLTGPSLWNIVGRSSGSVDGFGYSGGMSDMNITWGYEELDTFLERPAKYVKGTTMGYAGEGKEKRRAAIIEYLRTLSDNPQPRPTAAPAALPADDMVEELSAPEGEAPKAVELIESVEVGTDAVIDNASEMATDAGEMAKDMAGDAMETVESAAETVGEGAGDVMDKVEDGAKDLMDAAEDKAKDLVTSDE